MKNQTDDLSKALEIMQDNLRKVADDHAEKLWMQNGISGLTDKLRGDKSLKDLSSDIIIFLAEYLNSQIGSFYVTENGISTLQYSYGLAGKAGAVIKSGEGLLGQAVAEKKVKIFDKLPSKYFTISSSLGEDKPDSLIIIPTLIDDTVVSVFELAKFGKFSAIEIQFLEEIKESIAISVYTSLGKLKLEKLVETLNEKEREITNQITAINRSNGAIEFDLNGIILKANETFCNLLGYTENEIVGKHHSIFVEAEISNSKEYKDFWKALNKGEFQQGDFKRKNKEDKTIWINGSYNPILDLKGKPYKVLKISTDITKAKNQQFELNQQVDALNNSAIVSEADADGNIIFVNDLFCEISEYKREELIGRNHRLLKSGKQPDGLFIGMWKAISMGKVWQGEVVNKKKGGGFYWVDTTIVPFKDAAGKIIKYVGIRFDITKQKEQQESLLKSAEEVKNQQLELSQQIDSLNNSAIVSIADADGNITFINDLFCKISEYSREELMGQNHRIVKSGKQSDGLFVGMWKAISLGKIWKGEILNKKKGGGFYWVDTTIVPFKDASGKIYKYVGIRFDITAQKEQQELLKTQTEQLRAQQEELEETNTAFLELQAQKLQASEEELIVQQEELMQSNQELEEKSQLLEEQNQAVNEKNEQLESASNELQEKAEELALSNKYKSEFLANMSHELRTPLNSILLLSKLMSDNTEGNLTKEQTEFASVINNSGNSLLQLINEILDLSKIESGKMEIEPEIIELTAVMKSINDMFNQLAKEKGVTFSSKKETDVPTTLKTDKARLEQVLKNFLSNAFKFTEKGSVELLIRMPNELECEKMKINPKDFISFEVKDSGIGIPKEKHAMVFEAFQQADGSTRRKYGGTGLGLSISREIAVMLGGEIRLESETGKGSSFILTIPTDASISMEHQTSLKKSTEAEKVIGKKEKESVPLMDKDIVAITPNEIADDRLKINKGDKVILIVEDDTSFATALLKYVHERGYKAVVAVSGANALPFALKYNPIGILLDIQLPVKSGWTIMKELKENLNVKHIPVHMMSSLDIKSKDSISQGAVDFINKPVATKDLNKMFDRIESVIGKKTKTILLVDDNEIHTTAINQFISDASKKCIVASNAKEAYAILQKEHIDCVVLDMGLPDENGYEVLERIKKDKKFEKLPVIIYTGKSLSLTEEKKLKQYAGAIIIKTADSFKRLSSEISLFLHLVEEKDEKKILKTPYIKDKVLDGKHVLIVDDDVRNIFSLTKLLESQKMKVSSASDGNEALEVLKKDKGIDMVLMDMMMPNKDGYETTEEIRRDFKLNKMPIIAVTAKAMLGDREKCIKAGANDYVTKPVDGDQLLSLLRVWLYNK